MRRLKSDQVAAALDAWQALEQRQGTTDIATSMLWTEIWLRHYGDLLPHEFLIAESQGKPRGICLLTRGVGQSLGPLPLRTLHVGTAGEPDEESVCVEYNRLLVEEEYRPQFCRQIVEHVERDSIWDQFQLDGFAAEDAKAFLQAMPDADINRRTARYFDLRKVRESKLEVITELGSKTRANIRRRLRHYGDLTVEWAESLTQAEEVFSELVMLHQNRWTAVGQPGAFASRRFHDFQLELLVRGLHDRRVELFRIRQGRHTFGCLFMLVDRNRLLGYISGFAPFEGKSSPGLVSHYLCIEEAVRRGYDAYDFLAGDNQHKRNLSNAADELVCATWRRDRLKYRVADVARHAKRAITRDR